MQKKQNFKKILSLIALSFFISQSAIASDLGVLDLERIIKDSKAMRDIQTKVNKKQDDYQKEITKKQNDLEAEQKVIEGKKNVLSKEGFEKEIQKFEKKVDDLKNYVDRKQNSLKKASIESMSKVNEIVKEIVDDISKDRGFKVIVPASQTIYFNDSLDVTEEVLTKLDKKITKVDVKFE